MIRERIGCFCKLSERGDGTVHLAFDGEVDAGWHATDGQTDGEWIQVKFDAQTVCSHVKTLIPELKREISVCVQDLMTIG